MTRLPFIILLNKDEQRLTEEVTSEHVTRVTRLPFIILLNKNVLLFSLFIFCLAWFVVNFTMCRENDFWIIAVVRIAIACKHQPEYQFEDSFSTIESKDNKETTSCSFCNEGAVTDSPLFSFSSGDAINQ